jgi:hypothetical protein
MIQNHLNRALLISAGLLLATAAMAQAPQAAAPAKANAVAQAHDTPGKQKPEDKGKTDVKPDPNGAKPDDATKTSADRAARAKAQHDEQRAKLVSILHHPMDQATREELKRHARRVARLERIKTLATDAKDDDSAQRAAKLLEKENARHDKWLTTAAATAQASPNDTKGGAR